MNDTMSIYRAESWERLRTKTSNHSPEGMVVAAAKAWQDLYNEINKLQRVPHPDYWCQSLDEVNYNLREAAKRLLEKE